MARGALRDRLNQALVHAGKKPAELAHACKVKPPSVSDWLSGKTRDLRSDNLFAASDFLNVAPRWLGTGEGPMLAGDVRQVHQGGSVITDIAALETALQFFDRIPDLQTLTVSQRARILAECYDFAAKSTKAGPEATLEAALQLVVQRARPT